MEELQVTFPQPLPVPLLELLTRCSGTVDPYRQAIVCFHTLGMLQRLGEVVQRVHEHYGHLRSDLRQKVKIYHPGSPERRSDDQPPGRHIFDRPPNRLRRMRSLKPFVEQFYVFDSRCRCGHPLPTDLDVNMPFLSNFRPKKNRDPRGAAAFAGVFVSRQRLVGTRPSLGVTVQQHQHRPVC